MSPKPDHSDTGFIHVYEINSFTEHADLQGYRVKSKVRDKKQ